MMHKAWSGREKVPCCLRGHTSNFKVPWNEKSMFLPNWIFLDCNSKFSTLLLLKVIGQISKSHRPKTRWFCPELSVSGLQLQFDFTDGYNIMHNVMTLTKRRSMLLLKVIRQISKSHRTKNRLFWPELSVSDPQLQSFSHRWLQNYAQSLKWHKRLLFFRPSVKFQCHMDRNMDDLNPICGRFPGQSQLSNPSDLPSLSLTAPV